MHEGPDPLPQPQCAKPHIKGLFASIRQQTKSQGRRGKIEKELNVKLET